MKSESESVSVSAFQTNVNVSFEFGKSLRFVDLESRLARFDVRGTESSESVAYDLLVGADGSESATRAALENEGALVCERNANGLYTKTVCLPPGFFEQTRASLFEKDGTGGPDPTPTPTVAESRAKELEKEKEKDDWRFRRHAWEHAGVVDAFAVPNAGKREGDSFELTVVAPLSRWKRVRTASDAETLLDEIAPGAFGCPDAPSPGVQSESARRRARRRDFDRKRRLDDVLAPDPPRRLGGARRRRRALGVADARAKHGRDAGNLGVPGRRAREARARRRTKRESRRGVVRESRATDVPSEGGPSSDDTDGGKHDFDVKTALAAYFEKGRAPAARAFVRLCETGFGSGDVGFKRRFENVCFFAKLGALTLLHKLAPFLFDAPALTKMDDPSWGYDDVEDETRRETGVVFAVVACVVSFFCATRRFGARASPSPSEPSRAPS